MSGQVDWRRATPTEVLEVLTSDAPLGDAEVRAALTNAFERIALLEAAWEETGRALEWFNAQMRAGQRAGDPE